MMRSDRKCSRRLTIAAVLLLSIVLVASGCTAKPPQEPPQDQYTKDKIEAELKANPDISRIAWSPDDTMVVYVQTGKPEKSGMDEAYIRKVGADKAVLIRDVQPTTHGFTWSPDSRYFLLSEKLGDGSSSSIIKADSLQEETYRIRSITIPVWSPDGTMLAFGNEMHDYGESWGSLEIYKLGAPKSEYIWNARNYLYKVESWDSGGNIGYIEIDPQGKESRKSTPNIRPSIAGVYLGDTKEQVKKVLGNNYKEAGPDAEAGHFPESVYRWDYAEGYILFFGAESGGVLEISTSSAQARTNLGVGVGDSAAKVFEAYRSKYIEPESIHGGIIYGVFKVEGAAALAFHFNLKEGQLREDIKPDHKVEWMVLTYPEIMDDSF